MNYLLTTVTALTSGAACYGISNRLGWHGTVERLLLLCAGVCATAFVCAHLWA
jgi:hypothetical protein